MWIAFPERVFRTLQWIYGRQAGKEMQISVWEQKAAPDLRASPKDSRRAPSAVLIK